MHLGNSERSACHRERNFQAGKPRRVLVLTEILAVKRPPSDRGIERDHRATCFHTVHSTSQNSSDSSFSFIGKSTTRKNTLLPSRDTRSSGERSFNLSGASSKNLFCVVAAGRVSRTLESRGSLSIFRQARFLPLAVFASFFSLSFYFFLSSPSLSFFLSSFFFPRRFFPLTSGVPRGWKNATTIALSPSSFSASSCPVP